MRLTRAQCLGLWALASEAPTDATIDILGEPDSYGHIIVSVRADSLYLQGERRYQLLVHGGRQELKADPAGSSGPEAG